MPIVQGLALGDIETLEHIANPEAALLHHLGVLVEADYGAVDTQDDAEVVERLHLCGRSFESVEQMNETLIKNINDFVSKEDTLYILGDISHKISTDYTNELIKRINGKKILIRGNHDKQYDESLFEGINDYLELNKEGRLYVMMHYPLRSWNKMRRGTIHLHGHIHATKQYNLDNRERGLYQYDVGVDANDYYPVSINQIEEFFKDVPLIDFEHNYSELEG